MFCWKLIRTNVAAKQVGFDALAFLTENLFYHKIPKQWENVDYILMIQANLPAFPKPHSLPETPFPKLPPRGLLETIHWNIFLPQNANLLGSKSLWENMTILMKAHFKGKHFKVCSAKAKMSFSKKKILIFHFEITLFQFFNFILGHMTK